MLNDPWAAFPDAESPRLGAARPPAPKEFTPQAPEQRQNTAANTARTNQEMGITAAMAPITRRNAELEGKLKEIEVQKNQQALLAKRHDIDEARQEMLTVIQNAAEAHRLSRNPQTTGWGSAILGVVPTTLAHDLEGKLSTIGGNIAFERLQRMRQESPTGGAVGNVSDNDLKLLKSVITSLDPTRSRGEFQASMKKVVDTYGHILSKMPGGKQAYTQWRRKFLGFDPDKQAGKTAGAPKLPKGWSVEVEP